VLVKPSETVHAGASVTGGGGLCWGTAGNPDRKAQVGSLILEKGVYDATVLIRLIKGLPKEGRRENDMVARGNRMEERPQTLGAAIGSKKKGRLYK